MLLPSTQTPPPSCHGQPLQNHKVRHVGESNTFSNFAIASDIMIWIGSWLSQPCVVQLAERHTVKLRNGCGKNLTCARKHGIVFLAVRNSRQVHWWGGSHERLGSL